MDRFTMNFDDFGPESNFFPCFPCWQGKQSPWAAPFLAGKLGHYRSGEWGLRSRRPGRAEDGMERYDAIVIGRGLVGSRIAYGLGPSVIGASWTPYDGHANPLDLLHALHKSFVENRGRYIPNTTVSDAAAAPGDFCIGLAGGEIGAPKVVLAAGLGNASLAPLFGLNAPVRPQRGQILVTERAQRVLAMPTTTIRQTVEAGIMLRGR